MHCFSRITLLNFNRQKFHFSWNEKEIIFHTEKLNCKFENDSFHVNSEMWDCFKEKLFYSNINKNYVLWDQMQNTLLTITTHNRLFFIVFWRHLTFSNKYTFNCDGSKNCVLEINTSCAYTCFDSYNLEMFKHIKYKHNFF